MKCEYCQNEITGEYIYHQRFRRFKLLDVPNPQPKDFAMHRDYVCEKCYTAMGIKRG